GGHHLARHVSYDETRTPAEAEARTLPLSVFAAGVPGPLCLGHPKHCQTLFDAAAAAGADARRGGRVTDIRLGAAPGVSFQQDGRGFQAQARLVVGADGRTSAVREATGVAWRQ